MDGDEILLREAVTLEDVMREVKALRDEVKGKKMSDDAIEQEIQAKGKTAARVTPEEIENVIYSEHYFTAAHGVEGACANLQLWQTFKDVDTLQGERAPESPLDLLTFCVLVLRNGFSVTGESACASRQNFDAEIGRKIARQNAVAKIWPLQGYLLKERMREE
jgi:hypothetical protein